MMLALDLGERVADRVQEDLVGVLDLAVQRELDDGLPLADRVDHAGIQPLDRDVTPFEHVTDVIVPGVESAVDHERDLQIADGDLGPDGQLRGVGQQLALMRRVLVERVNAGADDLVGLEARPVFAEFGFILLQQFAGRLVYVGDDEIPVDHHDSRGDLVGDARLQLVNIMATGCATAAHLGKTDHSKLLKFHAVAA